MAEGRFRYTWKIGLALTLMVVAIASAGFGGYYLWMTTPPDMPEDVDDVLALVESKRFKRLPTSRKMDYVEPMRKIRQSMTPEQREHVRERMKDDTELRESMSAVGRAFMYERARQFATADVDERRAMLDQIINMFEMSGFGRRGSRPRADGNGDGSNRGVGHGGGDASRGGRSDAERQARRRDRATRFQERMEHGHPQRQAYIGEFFKALRKRREERGLDPNIWPRRRRGGNNSS